MSFNCDNTRAVMAKLILNKIPDFTGVDEMRRLTNKNVDSRIFQRHLDSLSMETLIDLKQLAQKVKIEPTTLKHHLMQVYDGLVFYSPPNSNFNRSMIYIQFAIEICIISVKQGKSHEIRTIHEIVSRILIEKSNIASNNELISSWSRYVAYLSSIFNLYNKIV